MNLLESVLKHELLTLFLYQLMYMYMYHISHTSLQHFPLILTVHFLLVVYRGIPTNIGQIMEDSDYCNTFITTVRQIP